MVALQKTQGSHLRMIGERVERREASSRNDYRRFEKRFVCLEETLETRRGHREARLSPSVQTVRSPSHDAAHAKGVSEAANTKTMTVKPKRSRTTQRPRAWVAASHGCLRPPETKLPHGGHRRQPPPSQGRAPRSTPHMRRRQGQATQEIAPVPHHRHAQLSISYVRICVTEFIVCEELLCDLVVDYVHAVR